MWPINLLPCKLCVYLVAALIVFSAGATSGWRVQTWRYALKEKADVEAKLSQERLQAAEALRKTTAVIQAQNAANQRVAAARRDSADSYARYLGLHDDLAAAKLLLSTASADAVRKYADASGVVFDQCVGRYREVAQSAQGHASDTMTLQDAWPK